MYIHICMCIYIYIYIERERERESVCILPVVAAMSHYGYCAYLVTNRTSITTMFVPLKADLSSLTRKTPDHSGVPLDVYHSGRNISLDYSTGLRDILLYLTPKPCSKCSRPYSRCYPLSRGPSLETTASSVNAPSCGQ